MRTNECEIVWRDVSAAALTISSTASTAIPLAASATKRRRWPKSPPISTRRRNVSGLSEWIIREMRRRSVAASAPPAALSSCAIWRR